MPPEARRSRSARHVWLLLPAAALGAMWLSWRCLAAVDFLYPAFYGLLDIDSHVEEFGPQNRFKSGFETTTRDERLRLFSAIVVAIHASGEGLEDLEYHAPDGRVLDRLLTPPEVGHLVDVARLVSRIAPIGWLAVAWTATHLLLIRLLGWPMPPLGRLFAASGAATGVAVLLVMLAGPKRVFYAAHDLVFPPDHPWFFYYQDSLMTTMMKAPDLFGAIAAALLVLALGIYAGLLWLGCRLASRAS
jgi:hypothetical protein